MTSCYFDVPLIFLKGNALFPHNEVPVTDLGTLSLKDRRLAKAGKIPLVVVPWTEEAISHPQKLKNVIGTLAEAAETLATGVVLKGLKRVRIRSIKSHRNGFSVQAVPAEEQERKTSVRNVASGKKLRIEIIKFVEAEADISFTVKQAIEKEENPGILVDLIMPYLSVDLEAKIKLLQTSSLVKRIRWCLDALRRENELRGLSSRIHEQVKGDLHEEQRRHYLREQILAIKRELGEVDGDHEPEAIESQLEKIDFPPLARKAADEELERLHLSQPGSPEYMVSYNYLTLVRDLPWRSAMRKLPPFSRTKSVLDGNHFGLSSIKERVLEYLAVIKHKGEIPGQILLLSGPPGVGKTSLARSIAQALDRPFARIAFGGMKDEAEIRGHRRTYIGSLPGKIVQSLKDTGTAHCVILLDEIDKISGDKGSGIEAALLEVLDKEQNDAFIDHYLAVPFDLSKVLFIATANDESRIIGPLQDRLEVIRLPSYTEEEKREIAKKHLIPELRKELNLKSKEFAVPSGTIDQIMRSYTRESGVRQLKRELTALGRKVVRSMVEQKRRPSFADLTPLLGPAKYIDEPKDKILSPGVAIGLAYTEVGGELLYIETNYLRTDIKSPVLKLTGSLGKVMKESADAALSYLCTHAGTLGVDINAVLSSQIHLHLPDGGTPKDGPSAGVAILCAFLSTFLGKPLPATLAMTGEITLRGQILPVGGIKEKFFAAYRYGKQTVLYPADNAHDLYDVPKSVKKNVELVPVRTVDEVLDYLGWAHGGEGKGRLVVLPRN